MNFMNALLALHILGAVVWVGGMAFALLVLRPSLAVLEPPQRLALHAQVFRRFFRYIWHAMPIMLLTGYAMLAAVPGGFSTASLAVNIMQALGLIMAVVFLVIFFGPWRTMRAAMDRKDNAAAAAAVDKIRQLVRVNLILGTVTVLAAAWGA
jgi:uncharacterized membrane protein